MKKLLFFAVFTLLIACNNTPKEDNSSKEEVKVEAETTKVDNSNLGLNNYAVIWNWKTDDTKLVRDNAKAAFDQTVDLWEKGIYGDVYYNHNATIDKLEDFPNISNYIKAKSIEEAKSVLDELTVVKKGISEYRLVPVGVKWLERNTEAVNKKGVYKTFVTVWSRLRKPDGTKDDDVIVEQTNALTRLWNEGIVENVYFDIEGTQSSNEVTDFVFYVNAKTQKEAVEICDNLPIAKAKIAYYKIHSVGMLWLKESDKTK